VDAVTNFVTALAVGWFVTAAVIVGVYLWRYARDMADLRRQEQLYADQWVEAHIRHQDHGRIPAISTEPNRYLRSDEGAPE
jgi:hypothetical protein